jgi:hypothetical protein
MDTRETGAATPNTLAPPRPLAAMTTSADGRSVDSGPGGPPAITWERRVSFLFNLDTWYDAAKALLVVVGVFSAVTGIVALLVDHSLLGIIPIVALILLVVAVATVLLMALLYPGGWRMRFTVAGDGIAHSQKLHLPGIYRPIVALLRLAAYLQGRPAGDISKVDAAGKVTWKEVHRVKVDSRRHVAVVMGKWNCAVRVYCPPEQWEAVIATLRRCEVEGQRQRGG